MILWNLRIKFVASPTVGEILIWLMDLPLLSSQHDLHAIEMAFDLFCI